MLETIKKYRRDLHQIPELELDLAETTNYILNVLEELDCIVSVPLQSTVLAYFDNQKEHTLAFRSDMDALPVTEQTNLEFQSKSPGKMHACGHDFHTAIGLVLARWISEQRAKLRGKIILLFHPAEEGSRGARAVSASGLLDEADYFAAAHVGMMARTGEVVIDPYGFLCGTKFNVDFKGRAAHCASEPEAGKNALAAACSAFMLLQGISRSSKGASRINVGKLSGGRGRNIIPDQAYMEIDLRGETTEVNDYLVKRTQEILKGTAQSLDVQLSIEDLGTVYDIKNDPELVEYLKEVASQCPLVKAVTTHSDFGGSEDASIIIKRIQQLFGKCIYFVIGADRTAGHHQPDFDADEAALEIGFEMFKGLIRKINGC